MAKNDPDKLISNDFNESKHKITPEKAVKLLAKDGIIVSEEQAEKIIDFLYTIAEIAVDQYLKSFEDNKLE